jgi:ABC-type thiamine transport system substrate-binding protein
LQSTHAVDKNNWNCAAARFVGTLRRGSVPVILSIATGKILQHEQDVTRRHPTHTFSLSHIIHFEVSPMTASSAPPSSVVIAEKKSH